MNDEVCFFKCNFFLNETSYLISQFSYISVVVSNNTYISYSGVFKTVYKKRRAHNNLYFERHDDMSEIFFFSIQTSALDENRGEAGLKSYSYIITFDDLKCVNKVGRIEPHLVISFDFCCDFCFTCAKLCITRIETYNTGTLESHFYIEIVFSCDEADLSQCLYKF